MPVVCGPLAIAAAAGAVGPSSATAAWVAPTTFGVSSRLVSLVLTLTAYPALSCAMAGSGRSSTAAPFSVHGSSAAGLSKAMIVFTAAAPGAGVTGTVTTNHSG